MSSETIDLKGNAMPRRKTGTTVTFRALANFRRQEVIKRIGRGEQDVSTLAKEIAKLEVEMDGETYDSKARKRVYVALIQGHLPKLDEWGLIEYSDRHKTVKATGKTRVARIMLWIGGFIP